MTTLYQKGDGIEGEVIVFNCRKVTLFKKPISLSHRHKGKGGRLEKALCIINKRFTTVPEKQGNG